MVLKGKRRKGKKGFGFQREQEEEEEEEERIMESVSQENFGNSERFVFQRKENKTRNKTQNKKNPPGNLRHFRHKAKQTTFSTSLPNPKFAQKNNTTGSYGQCKFWHTPT